MILGIQRFNTESQRNNGHTRGFLFVYLIVISIAVHRHCAIKFVVQRFLNTAAIMASFFAFSFQVTLHATCLTLMAMTIDRYCAIVYAVQSRSWRTTTASFVVCLVVWLGEYIADLY